MPGYSGTPLRKKLGFKENFRVHFFHPPPEFFRELGDLPKGAGPLKASARELDAVVLFTKSPAELKREFARFAGRMVPDGMIWVSWPKKSSGVSTEVREGVVREIGLAAGWVDIKVCAVTEVWSGLKFVIPLKDRTAKRPAPLP